MKLRKILLATSLGVLATTSLGTQLYHPSNAEEGVSLLPQHLTSGVTRSQVRTNVMGAQREGTLSWISRGYPGTYPLVKGPSLSKSREQVLSELREWQKNPVSADGMRDMGGELGWVEVR